MKPAWRVCYKGTLLCRGLPGLSGSLGAEAHGGEGLCLSRDLPRVWPCRWVLVQGPAARQPMALWWARKPGQESCEAPAVRPHGQILTPKVTEEMGPEKGPECSRAEGLSTDVGWWCQSHSPVGLSRGGGPGSPPSPASRPARWCRVVRAVMMSPYCPPSACSRTRECVGGGFRAARPSACCRGCGWPEEGQASGAQGEVGAPRLV